MGWQEADAAAHTSSGFDEQWLHYIFDCCWKTTRYAQKPVGFRTLQGTRDQNTQTCSRSLRRALEIYEYAITLYCKMAAVACSDDREGLTEDFLLYEVGQILVSKSTGEPRADHLR